MTTRIHSHQYPADQDACRHCNTDRIVEAIHNLKENLMANLTGLTAAIDRLNTTLTNADTREAAESGADQATIDQAAAAVNAAADHVDTLDTVVAPPPAPAPAPATNPDGTPVAPPAV